MCFEIHLLYPQHFRSIFFVYCVVFFFLHETFFLFEENPNKEKYQKILTLCRKMLLLCCRSMYPTTFGNLMAFTNTIKGGEKATFFSVKNQFYVDENFMKSSRTQPHKAFTFPLKMLSHKRASPLLPPFVRFSTLCTVDPDFQQISLNTHEHIEAERRHSMPK
jgi:hypothetical protein